MRDVELKLAGRRWRVGFSSGEVFDDGGEFDGVTLVIELQLDETAAVATALLQPGAVVTIGKPPGWNPDLTQALNSGDGSYRP